MRPNVVELLVHRRDTSIVDGAVAKCGRDAARFRRHERMIENDSPDVVRLVNCGGCRADD